MLKVKTPSAPWILQHRTGGYNRYDAPKNSPHLLFGTFNHTGPKGSLNLRCYRPFTLFEKGEWVHVAWVWGQNTLYHNPGKVTGYRPEMRLFINGIGSYALAHTSLGSKPSGPPEKLLFGPNLNGAIDDLRISDVQRYKSNFRPPLRGEELKMDSNTRLICRFNGNLSSETKVGKGDKAKLLSVNVKRKEE